MLFVLALAFFLVNVLQMRKMQFSS
jgi:hypothetical protein